MQSNEVGGDQKRVYRRYQKLKLRRKKLMKKKLKRKLIPLSQYMKAVVQNTVKIDDKVARMIAENPKDAQVYDMYEDNCDNTQVEVIDIEQINNNNKRHKIISGQSKSFETLVSSSLEVIEVESSKRRKVCRIQSRQTEIIESSEDESLRKNPRKSRENSPATQQPTKRNKFVIQSDSDSADELDSNTNFNEFSEIHEATKNRKIVSTPVQVD